MTDTNTHKNLLEKELQTLESELKSVGRKNPDNPKDWEAKQDEMDTTRGDDNETADAIEDYEGNTAVLKELEIRFNEVKSALERIAKGTYGTCEVCKKPI